MLTSTTSGIEPMESFNKGKAVLFILYAACFALTCKSDPVFTIPGIDCNKPNALLNCNLWTTDSQSIEMIFQCANGSYTNLQIDVQQDWNGVLVF